MASLVAVSMGALIVSATVAEVKPGVLDVAVRDPGYRANRRRAATRWGVGLSLTVRIEPEKEAVRLDQYRHLFGHVFEPVVQTECGHTKAELCLMAKAMFMVDDGRTSLTQLNAEEMADFIRQCEVWLHTEYPEAFVLYDTRSH